ncbi:hypothetical protein SD81_027680 [Tolypothrix campylonemoides VB511288]|nr:hypothetical protein SD81_027680 [Tolypothrix campylonemoides VB511288]
MQGKSTYALGGDFTSADEVLAVLNSQQTLANPKSPQIADQHIDAPLAAVAAYAHSRKKPGDS